MNNSDIAREWFAFAGVDLQSALYLQTMHPMPLEIICYHCQQSAEKFLKGFLILHGSESIKTHDLVLLNKLCQNFDGDFSQITNNCLRLTDFGINTRYPYHLDIAEDDMKIAINDANDIKKFVEEKTSF